MTETPARATDYLTRALASTKVEPQPIAQLRALIAEHGADAVRNALHVLAPQRPNFTGLPTDALPQARATDPQTSHDAAADTRRRMRAAGQVAELLLHYEVTGLSGGLTAEDACDLVTANTHRRVQPSWRRVSDLRRLGLVESTGEVEPGSSGLDAEVLRITDRGRELAQQVRAAREAGRKSIRLDA